MSLNATVAADRMARGGVGGLGNSGLNHVVTSESAAGFAKVSFVTLEWHHVN